MKKWILIAFAALIASVAPVLASGINTVGYSFVDRRTGTLVTVASLTPKAIQSLPADVYVVQLNGNAPKLARLTNNGYQLQDGSVVADAGVFSGAAGISSVVAGSSGNLICTQIGATVTCDLLGGLSVSSVTYSTKVVNSASCGTAASGAASGSTCNGDVGFIKASATTSSVNFGNVYSDANHIICQIWDLAAPTTLVAPTLAAGSLTWTSVNLHTYAWHCIGVSGG